MDERREVWLLAATDQIVEGVHPASWCSGWCVVHSPSDHWMRDYDLGFDLSLKAFYRTCGHGARHQDPDERTYWTEQLESSAKHSKTWMLAVEKLGNWACPTCPCNCCDVTST